MRGFKSFIKEGYDIPLNTPEDIDQFNTKLDKRILKQLLQKAKANTDDIPFAGDEKGNIKVRGGISTTDLDTFRAEHGIAKGSLKPGSGSLNRSAGGKASNLSGADWEQVIVCAYNMRSKNVDQKAAIKLGGMEKSWLDKFDGSVDIGLKIVDNAFKSHSDKMEHYGAGTGTLSPGWDQYFISMTGKHASAATRTPKTDMYISTQHISLKKAGGSQLMSGGAAETLATLNFAYENVSDKLKTQTLDKAWNSLLNDIQKEFIQMKLPDGTTVNSIKADIKSGKSSPIHDIIRQATEKNNKMTTAIQSILETPEIKYEVVREAMTGANKFKDKLSAATHMMVFDETGAASYKPIDDTVVRHYADMTKFSMAFKSAGGKTATTLRGVVAESFEETEVEMLTEGWLGNVMSFIKQWFLKVAKKLKALFYKSLDQALDVLGVQLVANSPTVSFKV